jgi:uncharacterized protein YbbC (DUF1343 family)
MIKIFLLIAFSSGFWQCSYTDTSTGLTNVEILPGINQKEKYLPLLRDKNVAIVVNHTSVDQHNKHLADILIAEKIELKKIFAPEHGFRGEEDAGKKIDDSVDQKTGIAVISLYGSKKKPSPEDLKGIDVVIFDIQDVGVRFYTYISTLHYIMEACAEADIPLILFDRPNPNGHYIDGPVLDMNFSSFVGMHPVPVVYGMTIGEYAGMIAGEKWINRAEDLKMQVVECRNYHAGQYYELPIAPSPNLPNIRSILLYPSLCFFEGTHVSVGRGTSLQFQQIGSPHFEGSFTHSFTPRPNKGASQPLFDGQECFGIDFSNLDPPLIFNQAKLDLSSLIALYHVSQKRHQDFFLKNLFFDKLSGTDQLRLKIMHNASEKEIRMSWEAGLEKFNAMRKRYLIYDR